MSALFSSPHFPTPAAAAVPTTTDPAIAQAAQDQRDAAASAAGRQSTILTSGLGDTSAASVAKKTLSGQ